MKNKIIKALKDESLSQSERYNIFLGALAEKKGFMAVRAYQVGYTDFKYQSIVHEVKKAFEITDTEIYEFTETAHEEITDPQIGNKAPKGTDIGTQTQVPEPANAFAESLQAEPAAQEGLKIRDEYPFLNDPNCPDEFKILVADKITAWREYARKHADLQLITGVDLDSEEIPDEEKEAAKAAFEAMPEDEKEAHVYELAKAAVADFQLNADIKKELDFYRESGRILGDLPQLNDLRIRQEIYDLSEAELVEMKLKAQKNASKAEKEIEKKGDSEGRQKRVHDWKLREKLATERLEKEFPKKK